MNKITFLIIGLFFGTCAVQAQVLYNDDFENYTLGNLGTIPDAQTPGQGGWLTEVKRLPVAAPTAADNPLFTITNEPNRGKVLTLTQPLLPDHGYLVAQNVNLAPLIDNRNINNNVLKFEIDYYTGSINTGSTSLFNNIGIYRSSVHRTNVLFDFLFKNTDGTFQAVYNDRGENLQMYGSVSFNSINSPLPSNTWIKLVVYLDYANKKIYFETPYLGTVMKGDFLDSSTSTNLLEDFKPSVLRLTINTENNIVSTHPMISKYDNIKITALKAVPAHIVSTNSFLNEQFTVFPNPTSNLVHITNTLNLGVEEVRVYDLSGKLLKTQKVKPGENILLNIEELAAAAYMLHIKTSQGTAVKKIIKK